MNWDDMTDEMLRDLVYGLPRMMAPWEWVPSSREVALIESSEVYAPALSSVRGTPSRRLASAEVVLSYSKERDMVVWRWEANTGEGQPQRGESFNRQRAMADAEEVLRQKGFRFLPPEPAAPVMALVKGVR